MLERGGSITFEASVGGGRETDGKVESHKTIFREQLVGVIWPLCYQVRKKWFHGRSHGQSLSGSQFSNQVNASAKTVFISRVRALTKLS